MINFNKEIMPSVNNSFAIGVSMGEDSVALSHFLAKGGRRMYMMNVNHHTEYGDKASEHFLKYTEFLRETTRSYALGLVLHDQFDNRSPREADFRDYRYGLFDKWLPLLGINHLVVCHHSGDVVESYIMNTFNGVPEYAPIPSKTNRGDYNVIRPFLNTSKKEITNYIKTHNLQKWVLEDPSNKDLTIRRNWVRLKLLPEIKTRYPGIEKVAKKAYGKIL